MPVRHLLAALVAAILALFSSQASALCVITCSCAVSTTNVLFGTINPLSLSNTDSVGGVAVTCGGAAGLLIPLQVDISKGGSASYAARTMAYGTSRLAYNLYQDSGRSMVFGDGSNGTVDSSASMTLTALGVATLNFPVYGRVFGAQTTMVPGAYSDTIVVTLTYY
jgi:spore coat protein U-like protein